MRYLDRTGKRTNERATERYITELGSLTKKATRIAEENGLGLLKTHFGSYKVIRACGLGAYRTELKDLKEVDGFLKNLDKHESERL